MARITVEDCINKIINRFDLVLLATQRSKQLSTGIEPNVPADDDKKPVIALREIAQEKINLAQLSDLLVKNYRTYVEMDSHEKELDNLLEQDQFETDNSIEIGAESEKENTEEIEIKDQECTEAKDTEVKDQECTKAKDKKKTETKDKKKIKAKDKKKTEATDKKDTEINT